MTRDEGWSLGLKDGAEAADELFAELGIDVVRASLSPVHPPWDGPARKASLAKNREIPEDLHEDYYRAYREGARRRALEILEAFEGLEEEEYR